MKYNMLSLCILLYLFSGVLGQDISDIVDTEYGQVQGLRYHLQDDIGKVDAFLGVPFARPPLGDLRFRHPQSPDKWDDVYNATEMKTQCYQIVAYDWLPSEMSEDCLYLNVWAPATANRDKNVMVWIHGGAFFSGSPNDYDGRYLAAFNDVIVVGISYRLGAIGFLSMDTPDTPGNAGMLDQVMALQ